MNYLNGGYAMIKHNASQKDLENAYKTNRPVLVYDENQKAHWCQINEKVIETTDEETQETITTYEYSYQLLNDIATLVDSAGNPRFIEGDGKGLEKEGLTISYNKWSLSGSHLMCVIAGEIENATVLSNSETLSYFTLPDFIKDKIYGVWGNMLEIKTISIYGSDWSAQNLQFQFSKNPLGLAVKTSSLTTTAKRYFRVQFDLLIDADYSE